jgi:hypothetical protein
MLTPEFEIPRDATAMRMLAPVVVAIALTASSVLAQAPSPQPTGVFEMMSLTGGHS